MAKKDKKSKKKPEMMIQTALRDSKTGQFLTKKRAKQLSPKRVEKVALKKPKLSGVTAP